MGLFVDQSRRAPRKWIIDVTGEQMHVEVWNSIAMQFIVDLHGTCHLLKRLWARLDAPSHECSNSSITTYPGDSGSLRHTGHDSESVQLQYFSYRK